MNHVHDHDPTRIRPGQLLLLACAVALLAATLFVAAWGLLAPVDPYTDVHFVRIPTATTAPHSQWPWPGIVAPVLWVEGPRQAITIPDFPETVRVLVIG